MLAGAGSFALSFLNENGEINHFRISAICGDFYIGGICFKSLKSAIGYYTTFDLLQKERLVFPVPPPEVRKKEREKECPRNRSHALCVVSCCYTKKFFILKSNFKVCNSFESCRLEMLSGLSDYCGSSAELN